MIDHDYEMQGLGVQNTCTCEHRGILKREMEGEGDIDEEEEEEGE
jgi:hypothetical protein